MLTTIQILRVLVGLIAAWQIVGLLPVLTTWLPNLHSVTGGMWAIAFIKLLVMTIFGGAYLWLGKIKRRFANHEKTTSEARIIVFAIIALLAIGIVLAIVIPTYLPKDQETERASASSAQSMAVAPESTASQEHLPKLDCEPTGESPRLVEGKKLAPVVCSPSSTHSQPTQPAAEDDGWWYSDNPLAEPAPGSSAARLAGEWRCVRGKSIEQTRLVLHLDGSVSDTTGGSSTLIRDPWLRWYMPNRPTNTQMYFLHINSKATDRIEVKYPNKQIDQCSRQAAP